jgi:hypothetical protein
LQTTAQHYTQQNCLVGEQHIQLTHTDDARRQAEMLLQRQAPSLLQRVWVLCLSSFSNFLLRVADEGIEEMMGS